MQYVRYKNRVYSVGDDRSFFQTQFDTFVFTDNVNKSIGYAGWIDLTNPPAITTVNKYVMEAKNTYPVYGVELTIQDIIPNIKQTSQTLSPQNYKITGTNQQAFPVSSYNYVQEFYVSLLQESPDDSILNNVMSEMEARSIVYSDAVNVLVQSGMFIGDAIVQYLKQIGIRTLTLQQQSKLQQVESSNYVSSLSNTLLGSFQNIKALGSFDVPLENAHLDSSFDFLGKAIQFQQDNPKTGGYYKWGAAGGSDNNTFDGTGLISNVFDQFEGNNRGHFLTSSAIKSQYPNQMTQYSSNAFNSLKPGMVVTSNGHSGICAGVDNVGNSLIAHSTGGGITYSDDNSGLVLTTASQWNNTFGINYVAVPPTIVGQMPKGITTSLNSSNLNLEALANSKNINATNVFGEIKNVTPQGQDGIQAPFDPNDYGVPTPMPFVNNPPLSAENVVVDDADTNATYDSESSNFVTRQRSRQTQDVNNTNVPEGFRQRENFYPIFTGVIINIDKKTSVDGYVSVLTLKNPSVFLYSGKSYGQKGGTSPGVTTLSDSHQMGADIIKNCLKTAGFNAEMNTIELQNDQQDSSQTGNSATAGTSSVANASNGGGAQIMERVNIDNKSGIKSAFSGTPDENYQNAEDSCKKKYKNIITPDNITNISNKDLLNFNDDALTLGKLDPQYVTDFSNVISSSSQDALPSSRSGNSGGGNTGSGGMGSKYSTSWPTVTNRVKPLINIMSEDTEVYKGFWQPWAQWKDEKKTGKGGSPVALDGLTLKECIEAVASTTNYEAFFDEEGLFWYRAPQYDVNPNQSTRYWFKMAEGRYIKDFKIKVNYHKIFSGAYVSGAPIISDTGGIDVPTRVDAYVEDPSISEMIGWKPMINGDPYFNGSHFGHKYIANATAARYYALSQLDKAHCQFITGKVRMFPRPDIVLGHTLYIDFMDLVIYINRIIHTFTPGNFSKTETEIHFSNGRRFNDSLAYHNYGNSPTDPVKGMTVIDNVDYASIRSGGHLSPNSMTVIDIPPASVNPANLSNQLPSNAYKFSSDSNVDLNAFPVSKL